ALVVFTARRGRFGLADCLRQCGEFAALARIVTAKGDRRATGVGRRSRALATAIADRELVARGNRRRIGVGVCRVAQKRLARGRRLGAERAGTETGLAYARVYARFVVVDRNRLWFGSGVARYARRSDAGAERRLARIESGVAFFAQS